MDMEPVGCILGLSRQFLQPRERNVLVFCEGVFWLRFEQMETHYAIILSHADNSFRLYG